MIGHINQYLIGVMIATSNGSLLLTWIIYNPSMDNQSETHRNIGWNCLSISIPQQLTTKPVKFGGGGGGWISNFIPHFNMHTVTYPCKNYDKSALVKRGPGRKLFGVTLGRTGSLYQFITNEPLQAACCCMATACCTSRNQATYFQWTCASDNRRWRWN